MKKSFEFVKNAITKLTENFSTIKCQYEHDIRFSTHYIKVLPLSEFDNNQTLNNKLDDLLFDFIGEFPDESITFISEDEHDSLTDITFETWGEMYMYKPLAITIDFPKFGLYSELKIDNDPSFEDDFDFDFSLAA